jgi:hypothetical protein
MPSPGQIAFLTLVLGLMLWSLPGGEVRADTSFMAGDGENLVYGFSTLKVKLPVGENGLMKQVDHARLLGTIRGKPVVATLDSGGKNKLYMVDILNSKEARFSNLYQNIIDVDVKSDVSWNNILNPYGNIQPEENITRILEVPAPDNPDGASVLLLVNGTQNLWMLSLTEKTDLKSNVRRLKVKALKHWVSPERYINLDYIDLNAFVANKKEIQKEIPGAIAVWYQRSNLFFTQCLFQVQANSLALATLTDQGLNLYQRLEDEFPFNEMKEGPDPYAQPRKKEYIVRAITGGAFINPEASGAISYWFGATNIEYDKRKSGGLFNIIQDFYLETYKYPLYFDPLANRILIEAPVLKRDSIWWWYVEDEDYGSANGRRAHYIRHLTGPRIRRASDVGRPADIHIDNYLKPDKSHKDDPSWKSYSHPQGVLHQLSDGPDWEVTGVSRYDDQSDDNLTAMEIAEKRMVQQGANVVMVVYGWPYFGTKDRPSAINTPVFERKDYEQKTHWERSSNGGGFQQEVGFQFFKGAGWPRKFRVSEIGGFSFDIGDQTTEVESFADTLEARYHDTKTSFERFKKWGLVVFKRIKPMVSKYGRFVPASKDWQKQSIVTVKGLEQYRFEFPVAILDVESDTGLELRRFDMTNPDYELPDDPKLEPDPSPLSAGLAPRAVHTLAAQDVNADLKKIIDWERTYHVKDFILLADSKTLKPSVTGLKVVHRYDYNLADDKHMDFSKTHSKEDFNSKSWYEGANFKMEPYPFTAVPGFFVDLSARYNGSFATSDTTEIGKAYRMTQRGIDTSAFQKEHFKTYFIQVDIDKLQSFIAKGDQCPFKAKPAVIPDWNWNYRQDFTLVITVKGDRY